MLSSISYRIAMRLCDSDSAEDQEICIYAVELFLYSLFSTLGLICIGLILQQPIEACVIILMFYTNQTVGGGYHATTHLRCFLVMATGLVFCLLSIRYCHDSFVTAILAGVAVPYLWRHPVLLHMNKDFLRPRLAKFSHRSRVILVLSLIIAIIICIFASSSQVKQSGFWGLIITTISRKTSISIEKFNS